VSVLHASVNSDCIIVSYVSKFAFVHGCMFSLLGRSALYCRLRMGLYVTNIVWSLDLIKLFGVIILALFSWIPSWCWCVKVHVDV